jgi:putative ATP-binding cassette transporter
MKVIRFLFRYSRRTVVLAVIAGIVSGLANTGLLALINSSLAKGDARPPILLWEFIGLCLVVPLTRVASEVLLIYLGQATVYELRMQMCRRILAVPLRHLESVGAPRLLSALTGDIPAITNVVTVMPMLFMNSAVLLGCLTYLGMLSWRVLLAVLFLIVIGSLSYQFPVARAMRHFLQARERSDELYEHFRAIIDGIKELKLHSRRRTAFLDGLLDSAASSYRRHQIDGQVTYTFAASWGQLLVFMIIGLLLFAVPHLTGSSTATLTGYTLILIYLMTPLQVVMNTLPNLSQGEVALARVQRMGLDLAQHATEDEREVPPEGNAWHSLELIGVTHVYRREGEDGDFTLGPIDLRLEPGELVFIAGGNGSGKTTLAKVLVGLYPAESGEIRFDGEPVTDRNSEAYRQHFSVVFSDFYLFEKLLGLESAELDHRARRYLAALKIDHKVEIRDGKLSTTQLSQGQRKRLALLTAYLEDRPIYLFDEWAADQDPLFKDIFYLQILPELKQRGKTVLVISHDDRYYYGGDRIIRLDYGKVTEDIALSSAAS